MTKEFRAPHADMAYWGAASPSPLQDTETLIASIDKKLDKMHQLEAKLVIGVQLTPMEQQQIKPTRPEVLAKWPGHDYHGKFLENRIDELESERERLQGEADKLADDILESQAEELADELNEEL